MKTFTHKLFKAVFLLSIILPLFSAQAQAPQKMNYQAVIRNASNVLISNTAVGIKNSILQTNANGTVVYSERQIVTTNANGLAIIEIGAGAVLAGAFNTIDWANGPYFIKTETDPSGGINYTISGTAQLLSVPYALFAGNSSGANGWTSSGADLVNNNTGNVGIGISGPVPHKFSVESSEIGISQQNGSAGAKIGFYTSGDFAYLQTHNNFDLNFSTNNVLSQMKLQKGTGNLGLGNTGTLQNKLQIGNPPNFIGNDLAIGNGTQGMSIFQAPTTSLFYTNTNFAFMPAGGTANVGIGTTTPTAKLDVRGSLRVSENNVALGTVFKQIQAGTVVFGSSPAVQFGGFTEFTIPFATVPHIIATPVHQEGISVTDSFAVTITQVSTTGFSFIIRRLDGSSWAQQLKIDWIGLSY